MYLGRVTVDLKIGSCTKSVNLIVVNNSNYDLLIGLDLINTFNLNLNQDYRIFQLNEINKLKEQIQTNYSKDQNQPGLHKSFGNLDENKMDQTKLSKKQERELQGYLTKMSGIFSKHKYDIGTINIEKCKIELENNVQINLRPYRCSSNDQKTIDSQLSMLIEHNLIRPSVSPYAFPVTLADKKDEGKKSRLCIDYRKLNQIAISDHYPFPRVDDILDKLFNCEYFTTLDISSGYWHIPIEASHIYKTAFITMNGHYEWLVMPFGYKNAPSIFQRIIFTILQKHKLTEFCSNYLDDILIYSLNFSEHMKHIELVLDALYKENIRLKLSKCKFAKRKVTYLGHIISKNEICPLMDNVKAIKDFPTPNNVKSLQRFLGKVNYYHRFIPNAPKLLSLLYALLKKKHFRLGSKMRRNFQKNKNILNRVPNSTYL